MEVNFKLSYTLCISEISSEITNKSKKADTRGNNISKKS